MDAAHVDVAALVYHELRAPLGLVATAARSMADDAPDEDLRLRCEVIVRAAERMLRTAETVADLGGPMKSGGTYRPVAIVTDLVRVLSDLGVRVELTSELDERERLCGAGDRFEALVHSVIANAIDHGEPGEPTSVRLFDFDHRIAVEVTNAVAREDQHNGNGLGAIIAAALARGLGARVDTFIREGRHVARITLPRTRHSPGLRTPRPRTRGTLAASS